MKTKKQVLALIIAVALLISLCPAIGALAADNDFTPPEQPSVGFNGADGFVPGEVVASADSLDHAQIIAAVYGLRLKSYAYGIAILAAPDPQETVAYSMSMSMNMGLMALGLQIPSLSLNKLYQTYETVYDHHNGPADLYDIPIHEYAHPPVPNAPNKYGITWPAKPEVVLERFELYGLPPNFLQWQHEAMDNERAWEISMGKNAIVAVIDSGIDIDHHDFAGRILANSYNSYTDQVGLAYVQDDHPRSHGTHVSGIIAGALNNSAGVSGVAPQARIMTIKANDPLDSSSFEMASLLRGINYAVENGADIINMSLGRDSFWGLDQSEYETIANAVANGVTVVCAAGNDRNNQVGYPAAYPETIAVSALKEGCLFEYAYSNYGLQIDLAAPGSDIYSTVAGGGYERLSGTSMASPCVAGTAALIKSLHPEYDTMQVRNALCQTARNTGELGRDDYYGYGIVNSYAAVLGPDALCNITFIYNDGVRDPVTVKTTPGDRMLAPYAPQWPGHAFAGWYIKGTDSSFDFKDAIHEDMSLYAQWAIVEAGMYIAEFPDIYFRREVLRLLNADGGQRTDSSFIDVADIGAFASITELNVENMDIRYLTGLTYFSGLQVLNCSFNYLTNIDLSNNGDLVELAAFANNLTVLDVTNNKVLKYVNCSVNQLTELDISHNNALTYLECGYNQLTELDISNNSALEHMVCSGNQLTELDISHNSALTYLECGHNQLTTLDVSIHNKLEYLYFEVNKLTSIDVTNNIALAELDCSANQFTALDVTNNSALDSLYCSDNLLSSLDVTNNRALTLLYCARNQLTTLDMTKDAAIKYLQCHNNRLTALDVANYASLEYLSCDNNLLTQLDLSGVTSLKTLYCEYNQLTKLDLSNNIALEHLYCYYNLLSELDVSNSSELKTLWCNGNRLKELDITNNTKISGNGGEYWFMSGLYCSDNQLTTLDLSKNTELRVLACSNNKLTSVDVSNNPALVVIRCNSNYLTSPDKVKGWQNLGLIINSPENLESGTFWYYNQQENPGTTTLIGQILHQTSTRSATIELFDSEGDLIYNETTADSAYTLTAPTGAGYTLVITKPGYLSYTVKNLTLSAGVAIETIDLRQMAGDIDGNGVVNATDLTYLLSEFNRDPANSNYPYADIDGNGVVNATDLTYLLAGFNKHAVVVDKLADNEL